jgi:hypothetical protein
MYPQIIRIKDGRGKFIKDVNIQLPKLLQDNDLLTYEGQLYLVMNIIIEIREIKGIAQGQYIAEIKKLK